MPVAVAAITVLLLRSLANKYDYQPFFLTLALFALSYAGLGISTTPDCVVLGRIGAGGAGVVVVGAGWPRLETDA